LTGQALQEKKEINVDAIWNSLLITTFVDIFTSVISFKIQLPCTKSTTLSSSQALYLVTKSSTTFVHLYVAVILQAVDVVGQAGNPKTITGFQTHTTPVLLAYGERAELATEECILLFDGSSLYAAF